MDKQFLPVVVCVLTVFLILMVRPSFLVYSSDNKNCPYCLNNWLVALIVLLAGGLTYTFVDEDFTKPLISLA